jgi:hypothetical protein
MRVGEQTEEERTFQREQRPVLEVQKKDQN